jgi:hypothetical protein
VDDPSDLGPRGQAKWGVLALAALARFWLNAAMQMRRAKLRIPARRAAQGVAAAPLMAALALLSTTIAVVVALGTVSDGRLPANGSIGMVCALVLAAVAVVEASRPARTERARRRIPPPLDTRQDASGDDVPTTSHWR